jgi:hypothetical protein
MRNNSFLQARRNLEKSLEIFIDVRDTFGPMMSLIYFAELAKAESKPEVAAKLFAAVAALCKAAGTTLFPLERATLDRSVAELRTQLMEVLFNAAWAEGQAMTLAQALEYALVV